VDGTAPFAIRVARGPAGQTVISVTGDLDLVSSELMRGELGAVPAGASVVLDLREVDFCDSAGLRVLIDAELRARTEGGTLRLAAPGPALVRLLELTGVDGFVSVYPTIEAALAP
jgi:anti-sigma B factor antagonist